MTKNVCGIILSVISLTANSLWAGGTGKIGAAKSEVGLPPSALQKASPITRHRGKGELVYPVLDLAERVADHRIPEGDKEPGPGWGVPEGHNIGNAPLIPVIGKNIDRSGRGKLEIVADFLKRVEEHEASQRKSE